MSTGSAVGARLRWLTLAALLAALLGVAVCAAPATAALPVDRLIRNTCWIAAENVVADADDTDSCDTWVVNWLDLAAGPVTSAIAGDTVWLPYSLTNRGGNSDTFTLAAVEGNGWPVSVWDGAGGAPLGDTVTVAGNTTLSFLVAVAVPAGSAGGLGDSVTVSAWSASFSDSNTAEDSATGSVYAVGRLGRFRITAPADIFSGAAFGITVTAYDDSAGLNVMTTFDTAVTVTVDTGVIAPATLAGWANGVWMGNLAISGCYDTVVLTLTADGISETVAINVVYYWVTFDKAQYEGLRDPALITVWDRAMDTPAGTLNTVQVQVASAADQTGITLTLVETGLATATFTGTLNFTQGESHDNFLRVDDNGNIVVTYDPDGVGPSDPVSASVSWIGIVVTNLENVRSWPNPFRYPEMQEITIHNLPSDPGMVIEIYNAAAQRIRTLRTGGGIEVNANENLAHWDGRSDNGDLVASGTYVYLVRSVYGVKTGKLTFIK